MYKFTKEVQNDKTYTLKTIKSCCNKEQLNGKASHVHELESLILLIL